MMFCQVFNKKDFILYKFYDNFPLLSQVSVTLFVTVCRVTEFAKRSAVAFAAAEDPLLEALLERIFHDACFELAVTSEFVHLDELPL